MATWWGNDRSGLVNIERLRAARATEARPGAAAPLPLAPLLARMERNSPAGSGAGCAPTAWDGHKPSARLLPAGTVRLGDNAPDAGIAAAAGGTWQPRSAPSDDLADSGRNAGLVPSPGPPRRARPLEPTWPAGRWSHRPPPSPAATSAPPSTPAQIRTAAALCSRHGASPPRLSTPTDWLPQFPFTPVVKGSNSGPTSQCRTG